MSKILLKYAISSLDANLPFDDGTAWTGNDAVVYANFRKEVLAPLSSMYYGQSVYANNIYREVQLSFANTAIAMEYHTKRRSANTAAAQAIITLRQQKVNAGESAPFEMVITLTDENGNVTTLT